MLDDFFLSPLTQSADFEVFLEDFMEKNQPDLVIPCRDEEVVVLARISEKNPKWTSRVSLNDSQLAFQFWDKYLSSLLCQKLELPFAHTVRLADFKDQIAFPLIAKPKEGFASIGVRIIFSENQLRSMSQNGAGYILQEYLSEDSSALSDAMSFEEQGFPLHFSFEENKYSIQLHVSEKIENSSFFTGLHRMKNGVSYEVIRFEDSNLKALAEESIRKFHQIGFRGPLNIQLQRNGNGDFKIFEFNCRFTGATSARFYLGYNELDFLLLEKTGDSPFRNPVSGFSKARKVIQTIGIE